jgi:hypothetical protein
LGEGGFSFVCFRCEQCGKEWMCSIEELFDTGNNFHDADAWVKVRALARQCRRGGQFSERARQRCPQGKSDCYELAGSEIVFFD